jgi:cardiolipin synthase
MATLQVLAIASSVHVVMHSRIAQGTIAWVVAMNSMPAVAIPVYWLVGPTRFEDHVSAHRRGSRHVDPVAQRLLGRAAAYRVGDHAKVEAIETAERLAALPVLRGNDVELLVDGERTFESLFAGVEAAEEYILMQWFIVRDDRLGRRMRDALVAKAQQGVEVYFLFDAFGSSGLTERYVESLQEAGVHVQAFSSGDTALSTLQFNFRNHRKVTVVDGEVAWIGGLNLGDEYLGRHERLSPWRDAHVRIEGPSALVAQLAFVTDWNFMTGEIPPLSWDPVPADGGDEPVLLLASGPADELEAGQLMYVHAINSAQERIWISTPYFVPDQAVLAALQLAGLRGVDVRILLPRLNDHRIINLAAWSYFGDASLTGVKFYRFEDGFLHRKAVLIDSVAAAVGSANFDNRSFRLNFEITGLFMAEDTVGQVERMFLRDIEHSSPVASNSLEDEPFWFRLFVHASQLLAPLL